MVLKGVCIYSTCLRVSQLQVRMTDSALYGLVTAALLAYFFATFFPSPTLREALGSVESKPSFVQRGQCALLATGGPSPLWEKRGIGQLLCYVGAPGARTYGTVPKNQTLTAPEKLGLSGGTYGP